MDSSVDYAFSSGLERLLNGLLWTLKRNMLIFQWFYKHFRDSRVDPGGIEDGLWWNLKRKMLIFHWF